MADLMYTADFSQIAKEVRKNRRDLNDWATAVSGDLQKVNRNMTLVGKTSTLALNNVGRSMNRMGVLTQQAGYQVGDFIVQVQSGTNAFVAFGQQATQVAGTLTLLGGKWIAIGTALGIAIPLLTAVGAAYMRTRGDAEDAGKALDNFTSSLGEATKMADRAKLSVGELTESYGRFAESVQRASQIAAQAALAESMRSFGDVAAGFSSQMAAYENALGRYGNALAAAELAQQTLGERTVSNAASFEQFDRSVEEARKKIDAAAEAMGLTKSQADSLLIALEEMGGAGGKGPEAIAEAASYALDQLRLMFGESTKIPPEVAKMVLELERVLTASASAVVSFQGMAKPIGEAANEAARLAANLAAARSPMNIPGEGVYTEFDYEAGASKSRVAELQEQWRKHLRGGGAGGGGGGGGAAAGDRIGALAQSLATEGELLEMWYQDSLVKLQEFNAKELELLGGHAQAKERIEQEHQNRLAAIEQAAKQQRLSETAGLFGALASIAATGGKKMAKAAATFEAIQGVINAYGAAIKALNTPGISLPGRFAAYASVLAAGLRGVAAIRQAGGVGGGGGGGGGGRIATPASAAAASPQRVLIQGIGPNDLITGSQLSEIFDKLYEENENRGLVFQIAS